MSETRTRDDLMPAAAEAIVTGRHSDPFSILGMHPSEDGSRLYIRTFAPQAEEVRLTDAKGKAVATMERTHPDGLFAVVLEKTEPFDYRLKLKSGGHEWTTDDPYRFGTVLGELDVYLMAEGRHRKLYERLGSHPATVGGVDGVYFGVWAPNAKRVSVVGDFNGWDGRRHVMRLRAEVGVWEIFIPGISRGLYYKYEIIGAHGNVLPLKMDPLAFATEVPPDTSSVVHGLIDHDWSDGAWISSRSGVNDRSAPISIYEVHLGSWRRGDGNTYLGYDQLADELIPYVKSLGFTHVELLPISEHPFSGSWGYQPIGLYAPTSRFGTPEGFARFVDRAHAEGIGVIIDWVPAHFPTDQHGLGQFDGTALYEHADPREGFHKDWNTLIYNLGRNEVANFLEANGLFWIDRYHVDGLRVDAVASMLYRDYSRGEDWVPNKYGGRENLESISFLQSLNERVLETGEGAMVAAEESTAFPQVSRPVKDGGLGFNFKWNMGWMHDTLHYIQEEPVHRRWHHDSITFGLHYAFSEDFILPLSHDEVVHGKGSMLGKMPGDRWQKFANLRAYYAFMWAHPGKKLLFMGGEFAQEKEWNHDQSLDWHLLVDPMHRGIQDLIRDLNTLYKTTSALHEKDCDPDGFEWIDASDSQSSVFAFVRYAADRSPVVVVLNFTPIVRYNYRVGFPHGGQWREAMNTDSSVYGGSNVGNAGAIDVQDKPFHGREHSAELTLPPLGALIFVPH
ncbi:1,4-alpha-glucan branching protein GlgB [Acuticoccus sp. I52.16.1]|uniref:1,4-alpha-glucan branching protein GlgB n=1 Tax=Acuticoccus sp. I52.16.1 TaxID=2928472 RepID=UPI001FD3EE45|nr:1,4-alpha-glucan branching protein GlgB [Acuticoccus sp. I52.16.1]UOM36175.1 1,4-alpha-glucan branching protein GlgB [Acuticoccus sp. I52.16.1]